MATIPGSGSNPVTVHATSNTTTLSPNEALEDFNDSIVGLIDSGVTVDGFGLFFTSTLPGSPTIQITNNGTVSTDQNSNHALLVSAASSATFTYSGSGNVTDTGSGGTALNLSNSGTGGVDITVSGTSKISASDSGTGVETGASSGVATVTVDMGGTVQGGVAVSLGGNTSTNTLTNSGTLQGTGDLGFGVSASVGTVTNFATISGTAVGVGVENVTLTNKSGAMIETTGTTATGAAEAAIVAVDAQTAADITNNSGATIQATGPLGQVGILVGQTDANGAPIATGDATVHNNAGTISGFLLDGINTSTTGTTSITNSGSITGTGRSGIRADTATVENDFGGTISGLNGIFVRNDPTAGQVFNASTVFNDGTITGTGATPGLGATPIAIHFSTGSTGNTLTLGTDSVINGNVLGAGSDILQLAGTGSASFDVSNIGATAQYEGFSTFNKIDTSTWTLTGTGTQAWTVKQGTLQVDGTIGAADVKSGGVLDGTGTTGAVTVESGGTLAPGDSPGTITTGDLNLETGSGLSIEIQGTSPGAGGFDQVDVNGTVTLAGALNVTLLNGFTPAVGATFEIINNDGSDAVNGTFAGLLEGATFSQGGVTYSISYKGGTGNDVVLTVESAPGVHITKFVNGQDADTPTGPHVAAGSTVTFTYVVTDAGTTPLANVVVTDDKLGPITSFTGDTNNNGKLDPGETWTYTATATALSGQQTNTGTVTADDANNLSTTFTDNNPANYFGDDTSIHIVKFANGQDADTAPGPHVPAGSTVTFTYVVTNTGNVPLANVVVSDDKLGAITSFTGDTNNNGLLDTNETWTYTATATALAGQQANTGTATAVDANNPPGTTASDSNPAHYFGDAANAPGVKIVKFVNGQDADTPTGPHVAAGSTLTFTYVLTNTGNVPLANVAVSDNKLGSITSFTGDTNNNGLLDTSETWTYTATATAQAGQQTNIGTVTAADSSNPSSTTTDANPANYFGDASGIKIVKFVNGQDANTPTGPHVAAGSTVTFTYVVTDTGNVPLANVAVSDDKLGAITSFTGDTNNNGLLDPGETWIYTKTATALSGQQTNTGTVTAHDANSPPGTMVTAADPANYFGDVAAPVLPILGAGDFDTDADKNGDLLWQNADGTVVTWDMNGAQFTGPITLGQVPSNWHLAGTGQFDQSAGGGAGNAEAFFQSDAGHVLLWEIGNNHVSINQVIGQVPTNWHVFGIGDVNGDGRSDVLFQSDAGAILEWQMNGTSVVVNQIIGQAPAGGHAIALADFNHDGNADILFQTNNGNVVMWELNGTQIIANQTVGQLPSNWHFATTGDFNGDGNTDVLFRSDAGGVVMWEMNGTQVIANQLIGQVPTNWHVSGTADVNGDGKSDVIWTSDAGAHQLWEMNGTQVIGDLPIGPNGTPASPPLQAHISSAASSASDVLTSDSFAAMGGTTATASTVTSEPIAVGGWHSATDPASGLSSATPGGVGGSGSSVPTSALSDHVGGFFGSAGFTDALSSLFSQDQHFLV